MNHRITILRGPERVRKRPAVIFGSEDAAGVMTAFEMLLHTLAKEGMSGHSNQITVTQYQDDSIAIQDNGRGLFLASPDSKDDTVWKNLFCELYAGSAYAPIERYKNPADEADNYANGIEICSVQYSSRYMDVCVIRDGLKQTLHFEKGENIGGLSKTPTSASSGTHIHFKPDPEVFTEIALSREQLSDRLQLLAIQIPGIKTVFRYETETGFEETEFYYPRGIADYLQAHNNGSEITPVYFTDLTAAGQERYNKPQYTANVKVGVRFAENSGFIKCLHNLRELSYGGTHCDAAYGKIAQYLEWTLGCKIDKDTLPEHLQLVIVTSSEVTEWVNGARTGIKNILIHDLTTDALGEDFHHFIKVNEMSLHGLFGK